MAQILTAITTRGEADRPLPELLCVECAHALSVAAVAMTLMSEAGHQAVIGSSGPLASRLEEIQFDLGEGPGLEASRAQHTIAHDDLTGAVLTPWPSFASAALAEGIVAVTAVPLRLSGVGLGSLCVYRSSRGPLDQHRTATTHAYAGAAVGILVHLQDQMWPETLHPDLDEPMVYRAVVHQATGFLAVKASVGTVDALLLLRAHAFATDQALVHIAREVLSGRLRLHPEADDD
ncbi:GAF and ANTAR domain-containing protein [Nocardioides albidus]|uniref:GAF and ANTAR domain-containing protein n=1 Tax=Nocardioides albidus TaxID=1517589 RepID=A0A5C4VKD3_9ACTN|nr:ANTAR domain-containing protein [Nocardioides albidus]TNM36340.1 GAF and ANTAR domain-containing protein [Nocardioides albidus]